MSVRSEVIICRMTERDVIFLGAGFSHAATQGAAPLMRNFFEKLEPRKYWTLTSFLRESYNDPKAANVEEALLKLDQLSAAPLDGVDPFFDECRQRHGEVRRELDRYILELLNDPPIYENWATHLLDGTGPTTTVITTNYDNVAEIILSKQENLRHRCQDTNCHHCKMCSLLNDDHECGGTIADGRRIVTGALLKLHGSIAWRQCNDPKCKGAALILPDAHCRTFKHEKCACCGGECSPVLVPPSMVKSFQRIPEIRRMWNAAYLALKAARSITFVGFSFPRSDASSARFSAARRAGRLSFRTSV